LSDIEAGLKGIRDFLNYITTTFALSFGRFWDPGQAIRKSVDTNLAMIAKGNFDWPTLIANSETLAMNFEQEPDNARQQQEQQREMNQPWTRPGNKVGATRGDGVLNYQGKSYPFSISGLSLVDVGISNFTGAGKVYDLKSPGDLAGSYGAGQATFAVAGGASAMSMRNDSGVSIVILKNDGQESGTQFSIGPAGMKIMMK
jgi:hypothetical protein